MILLEVVEIQLPKYRKKIRYKQKICQEPGCGKEYVGHVISKFCNFHSDIRNRRRRKRNALDPTVENQTIKHENSQVMLYRFICGLDGCSKEFEVKVFPKQFVYPKFCEEHRSYHRRQIFLKLKRIAA
jgi:hypothetical protein